MSPDHLFLVPKPHQLTGTSGSGDENEEISKDDSIVGVCDGDFDCYGDNDSCFSISFTETHGFITQLVCSIAMGSNPVGTRDKFFSDVYEISSPEPAFLLVSTKNADSYRF